MEIFWIGARIVSCIHLVICIMGLGSYLGNMRSRGLVQLVTILETILEILTAISLFVATLPTTTLFGSLTLCKAWLLVNVALLCLDAAAISAVVILLLVMVRDGIHGFPGRLLWSPVSLALMQTETVLRLAAACIVIRFMETISTQLIQLQPSPSLQETFKAI